ncbi:MAG: phosphoribosyltransferase family protein [Dehalococcoidia bacterium]|nr:phosphoribosyltransferase family protein [Dehalococcoidia bacterium]
MTDTGAMYRDRKDAGRQLGEALREAGYADAVLLGIPRGGVIVAALAAEVLGTHAGIIVARKVGAPGHSELGIGAVTSDGSAYIDRQLAADVGAGEDLIEERIAREVEEAKRREELYGTVRPEVQGKTVVVVDDGLATGSTAIAAARAMRDRGAEYVVVAVPVGATQSMALLRRKRTTSSVHWSHNSSTPWGLTTGNSSRSATTR